MATSLWRLMRKFEAGKHKNEDRIIDHFRRLKAMAHTGSKEKNNDGLYKKGKHYSCNSIPAVLVVI
jgi:hypothetical protein